MRFRVDRDVLAEAVAWTARALPARPVTPVLAGLLLDVGDGLTVSGFDDEVSAQATVDVEVESPGRALVSGRLLAEISRSLPDRPVEIASAGAEVVVTCGDAEFGLHLEGHIHGLTDAQRYKAVIRRSHSSTATIVDGAAAPRRFRNRRWPTDRTY